MPEIEIKNWDNKSVGKLDLDAAVFDYPLKNHLIYEAVLAHRAAARGGHHKVKNRKEVSGGTRKLWRQKGTGRARVGDNRSPIWRHGGTVHGPQPRSYAWKMPKRMRRNALRSALAQKFREGKLICLQSLEVDNHKTKDLEKRVAAGLGVTTRTLLVGQEFDQNLDLAARNNPRLNTERALGVDIIDLLHNDTLVFSEDALKSLTEVLAR